MLASYTLHLRTQVYNTYYAFMTVKMYALRVLRKRVRVGCLIFLKDTFSETSISLLFSTVHRLQQ